MYPFPPKKSVIESLNRLAVYRRPIVFGLATLALCVGLMYGVTVIKSSSEGSVPVIDNPIRQQPGEAKTIKMREGKALFDRRFGPANLLINASRAALPAVPLVTATKTDALLTDVDIDGKADPGDTIRYTVQIGAAGESATGVLFNDTLDPNTMLVGGSVMTTPLARNDSYNAAGNIRITIAAPGVLANDNDADGVGPAITATAGTFLSAQSGNVNLTADGSFTYNPPAGYEGIDTFTYTLNDNEGNTDTATVSITVSGMIWFINNNASSCLTLAAGCGRLTSPFSTLAAFQALNNGTSNNPAANDNIFVYESATDYVGPVTLLNGQKFIGQDATATLSSISGVAPPAGSDPLPSTSPGAPIVNITSAGIGITVGQNNTLRGFTGGNSASDIAGGGFGTLNVSDVTLNGNGRALDLTTGTLNGTFGSISSTNSATTGISLTSVAGSLTTGSTTVTNPTGIGISVSTSSAALSFANTSATGSGGTGIILTTNTGTITFGAVTITPDANQRGLLATDNTQTITIPSGTVTTSGATAVEITRASGTTPLIVSLTTVSANGGSRGIMLSNTSGSFTITGTGGTCINGNTAGCSGGTIASTTGADDSSATPIGTGVVLNNASNVSLTRMFIHDHSNYGIRGTGVSSFTLDSSVLNGTNGTDAPASAASPYNEGTIKFDNLAGAATISNTFISGGISNNVRIVNTSATVNRVTFTNDTIGANSTANGEDGILLESENTGRVLATIQNTTFTSARGDLFNFVDNATSGSADDLIFNNNTLSNNHPAIATGGGGVTISSNGTKDFTFHVENNTMRNAVGHAVLLVKSTGTASYSGTFTGNTIGVAATANSGSAEGSGLKVQSAGQGTLTVAITNNQIHQYNNNGIELLTGGGATAQSGAFNAIITGNAVDTPGNTAGTIAISKNGIHLNGGTVPGDTFAICAEIGGAGALANSIATSGKDGVPATVGDIDFRLRQRQSTTVRLPGYAGGSTDTAAVGAFLAGNNGGNGVPTGLVSTQAPGGGFVGGAACTAPSTFAGFAESAESSGISELLSDLGNSPDEGNILALTQGDLDWMVQSAISRWQEAGMSGDDLVRVQELTFEVTDLPKGGLVSRESNRILIDRTAAGYGWYIDSSPSDDDEFELVVPGKELQALESSSAYGKIDLLTAVMRGLGSSLARESTKVSRQAETLMEGSLGESVRRAPILKIRDPEPSPMSDTTTVPVINDQAATVEISKTGAKQTSSAGFGIESVGGVSLNIGDLPAGKSVTITFDVTVNGYPLPNNLSNQGTVSGSNFSNVLTDDPAVGGSADPTLTPVDQPDVSVAVAPSSVLEDGADNLVYTFTREGPTDYGLTVNFSVGGTASFNTDYPQTGATTFNGTSGTVTFSVGSSTATVTLDPTVDTTVESNETAILTVISGTSYDVGTPPAATGTINNDDTDVSVAVAPSSTSEDGSGNLVYTFTRVGVTTGTLTANFTITGTATFNTDYTQTGAMAFTPPTGSVQFGAGNTTATVTIDPTADTTVEPDETAILTVTTGTGYNVGVPSAATGTISNDDTDVSLAVAPTSVPEDGPTNLVYTLTRTGVTSTPLTVNFTIGGTATFNTDYTQTGAATFGPPAGTVTFGAGNSTATITVDPTADGTSEPDETVVLNLTTGTGYSVIEASSATGTISNDDVVVSVAVSPLAVDEDGATNLVYTFTRNDPAGALTANFSVGGTATFNTDYSQTGAATFVPPNGTVTFADGSLTATVTVDPAADNTVESDETLVLTVVAGAGYGVGAPSSATGTIINDDTDVSVAVAPSSVNEDGATNLVFTITRTGVISGAVTANFTIGGTGTFNADYTQSGSTTFAPPAGTVDFLPGSSTATVTIDPTSDTTVEPDETVILTVAAGTGYNIGASSFATGTIANDDTEVSFAVSPSSVAEDGATNMVYTFTRNGVTSSPLTVNFSIGGTATFNTDYTQIGAATFVPPNGTVIFGAGNATATVTVNPTADLNSEPDETLILTVVAGAGYNVGIPSSATGTILNDDAADVEITAKTDTPDPVCVGQNITYTIGFRNNSAGPAVNARATDTIPANTKFVSATLPAGWSRADSVVAGGTGTLMFIKSSAAGGETALFTVVVNVNTGTTGGTIISNTATASSDFPDDVPGNNSKTATTTVDPTPPVISGLSANPASLWPKNHKMRDVAINYSATDSCGGVTCTITNITSNEPINGTGDGDTAPDWELVDNHNVRLRAESAGGSVGRTYTITVTCIDAAGNVTNQNVEVHVGHNILTPKSGTAFKINTAVTFTGTFWDVPGRRHTAAWQFDSLTTGATVVEPVGSKNGTVKGTYTFKEPGVYKVTLKVTDNTGVTSYVDTHDDVEAIIVVYDPASGYTIGGGWIHSPMGSLMSDPSATGKMTFGFNSKVFKGATNPKGESQLDFLLGNFEFNALNYEYLVIDRARAQFRGFGKVNGVSGYDFIATVIDGSLAGGGGVDKFRIKIWEKTTGIIVYDNQMGASDSADPLVPVGLGSDIVIKK